MNAFITMAITKVALITTLVSKILIYKNVVPLLKLFIKKKDDCKTTQVV